MKRFLILAFLSILACKTENKNVDIQDKQVVKESNKLSIKEQDSILKAKGFKTFYYVEEKTKDTFLMQEYYIAFLKAGPIRSQNEEERNNSNIQYYILLLFLDKSYF